MPRRAARERALRPPGVRSARARNAIRAIHRGELRPRPQADGRLARRPRRGTSTPWQTIRRCCSPGYVEDAEKEYAEARLTAGSVLGEDIPEPDELGVEDGPYLNGMAESIGEGRRRILDLLRRGEVAEGERILDELDDLYGLLVTMDYPDAVTGNLRRSTDIARSLDREDARRPLDRGRAGGPPRAARRVTPRRSARTLTPELERSARVRALRGCSSAGRALPSHGRGQGFKSPHLHPADQPPASWAPAPADTSLDRGGSLDTEDALQRLDHAQVA